MKSVRIWMATLFASTFASVTLAGLPSGYAPVNCIVSTGRDAGKQWINTGYTPKATDKIAMKVKFKRDDVTMALYCARGTSGSSGTFTCFLIKDSSDQKMKLRFDRNTTTSAYYPLQITKEVDYEIWADGNTCQCQVNENGAQTIMGSGSFTVGSPLVLFASHTRGTQTITTENLGNIAEYELYAFKVTDKDGNVKVDMVPCRETKDGGVAGLYDLQRNAFYPSQSGTAFEYVAEPPAAPATPKVDVKTGRVEWEPSSGANAWYLERQIGSGEWTGIYCAESVAACSYVDSPNALNVSYRIAASNAQDVVRGEAVNVRLPVYSVGFGANTERIRGRFMPTKTAFPNSTVLNRNSFAKITNVPAEYVDDAEVFSTYARVSDYGSSVATATFTGLESEKTYGVRVLSMENWTGITVGYRKASLQVNGSTVLTGMDAYAKAGNRIGCPVFWDADGVSTAEGTMRVGVQNTKEEFCLYGLELYELDATAEMLAPELTVGATAEYAVLRCDTKTGAGVFEIQMSESAPNATTEGTVLYAAAPAEVRDPSLAKGATRWYRARRKWMNKASPWSDWQSATRPAEGTFRTALRLNMDSKNAAVVEGWELDKPYRQAGCSAITGNPMAAATVVTIPDTLEDPAPEGVYRTRCQVETTTSPKLGWTVSGFEPYAAVKVRLHVCEEWTGCSVGSRIFHLRSRYLRVSSLQDIDVFKQAGSKALTATVAEGTLYADGFGQIDLNITRVTGVPIIRGIELLAGESDSPQLGGTVVESVNADGTRSGRGRLYVPYADDWSLTLSGRGKVTVWMDGVIRGTYTLTDGNAKTFFAGALSEGVYSLHYEFAPADESATCVLGWTTWNGPVGIQPAESMVVLSADEPAGTGEWSFTQLGDGATVPYVEANDANFKSFTLSTTGNSMYYAKDDGSYLYRTVASSSAEFTLTARFVSYACEWTGSNTRIGFAVRDTLENGANGSYVSFHGFDASSPNRRLTYYSDLDANGDLNITADASQFVTSGWNDLPVWMRVTRTNAGGRHRYVFEYSHDGINWEVSRTQEVSAKRNSYVGILAMPSVNSGKEPLVVTVDTISYAERQRGLIVIFK